VVTDGHGAGLDRATHAFLGDAIGAFSAFFGSNARGLPLEQQMLYAGLVTWQESGGIALGRNIFALRPKPAPGAETTKSLGDDGVACVQRGLAYYTSFDYFDTTVVDQPVTVDTHRCNGMCGPYCTELSPWNMWTLDCLEHDQCCRATDDDTCWSPFNECGDEYLDAERDFLRGFDPFSSHCGG
jgi:hypothetical protein